ncbi:uncharacterized protein LOC117124037 isoform X1 [Anneissia japonica]|uniref:uncharacterized protein LOC117124037 isoform X1 n=1 Tax=Anneissia japonica TaxID=1529436 RepID=UPI00142551AC|nr:uncharacterized protein LOC117124037 isoform X1 [Anneissia japonica]
MADWADSTNSGVEVMAKQDVAEEQNHALENESNESMSETGSSNIVEGGVDDDSSTLLHFKESKESGSRLHTVPRFQISTLTTDSMLDKSALLIQRSSTPNQCHQQETGASNLLEDASGDHSHSTNIAEEKLIVPQSGISYADSNGYLDKQHETDAHSVEENGKENSGDLIGKTSLPDHPLSGKKKQSDISVVNLNRIIKLAQRRKKELFKSHVDDLKSLEASSNKGDVEDSKGKTTGGFQSWDGFHRQPHKEEVEEDNKDSAFELQCKTHGRPKSHFCISCEVYTCFQCLYTHFGHDVKHKDEIVNSIMEKIKFMSDCIASSKSLVNLHGRNAIKQQFLGLKQNTDGYLRKFGEYKCAQIKRLNQEESRLQDEIADMHQTKKQIWKQKKQLLKNVEKDLQIIIAKAKLNGNSGNEQNLQQKLQYLKRGQEILDKLPSLYCQVLSHEVDPEPVDIQMDPISNKWKFVKSSTVFKPELDESLTYCAAVSKNVKFKATEGCDKVHRGAENDIKVRYRTVSSMTEFENWSFEEIRWSHYVSEKIVSSSQQNKLMLDPLFDFGTSFVGLNSAKSTVTSTWFSPSKTSSRTASLFERKKTLSAKTAVVKTSNQATPTTSSSGTCSFGSNISAFEQQKTSLDPTKPVQYSGTFSFDSFLAKFEQPKSSSDQTTSTTIHS